MFTRILYHVDLGLKSHDYGFVIHYLCPPIVIKYLSFGFVDIYDYREGETVPEDEDSLGEGSTCILA